MPDFLSSLPSGRNSKIVKGAMLNRRYGTLRTGSPQKPPLTTNGIAMFPLNAMVFFSSSGTNTGGISCFQGDSGGLDLSFKRQVLLTTCAFFPVYPSTD